MFNLFIELDVPTYKTFLRKEVSKK